MHEPQLRKSEDELAEARADLAAEEEWRKEGVESFVLPRPVRVQITNCRTLGGAVGRLKYLVEGRCRPLTRTTLFWWKLRGTMSQVG
jgi:hypothetical protein